MRRLFIESSLFSREIKRLIKEKKISEDDYKIFQEELLKRSKGRFGNSRTWGLT